MATNALITNVAFGSRYLLLVVSTNLTPTGLRLDLAWQSLADQKRDQLIPLHVIDSQGKILAQADYKVDKDQGSVTRSTKWLDSVTIPYEKLRGATAIGLGVLNPDKKWETANKGQRDWENHRLLLQLPSTLPAEALPFEGNFEALNCHMIVGWVWNRNEPNTLVGLEIITNGQIITNLTAGDYREDLEKGHIGDGKHGFRIPTPDAILDGKPHWISIRVNNTPYELNNSPKPITCVRPRAQ